MPANFVAVSGRCPSSSLAADPSLDAQWSGLLLNFDVGSTVPRSWVESVGQIAVGRVRSKALVHDGYAREVSDWFSEPGSPCSKVVVALARDVSQPQAALLVSLASAGARVHLVIEQVLEIPVGGLDGVSIISAPEGNGAATAESLFTALLSDCGEALWACRDITDWEAVRGTMQSPSRVVEASWSLRERALHFHRPDGLVALANSPRALATIYDHAPVVYREVVGALRQLRKPGATLLYGLPMNFLRPLSPVVSGVCRLHVLCGFD